MTPDALVQTRPDDRTAQPAPVATDAAATQDAAAEPAGDPLVEELLVEEISIDGMCGVY